ncbi:DUF3253 domain-containing protein [uncultured Tateyamaria sp.]|uniref:DUF3253 domain-containing protein n=1 Tax=uncultured Tateyamaria sp. TaxID=455651 RepID=UPI00262B3D36|nr:DUF3253 domain-containing protein [uncultured Tateyamaria sp.]
MPWALAQDWRPRMPQVRAIAEKLVQSGDIVATQKGTPVSPTIARSPIRLGLPSTKAPHLL